MAKSIQHHVAYVACGSGCASAGGDARCSEGCIGCGACVTACPTVPSRWSTASPVWTAQVHGLWPVRHGVPAARDCLRSRLPEHLVRCNNTDKGAIARKICDTSCIGCGMCAKKCPAGAIRIEDNCAHIDGADCLSCGMCAVVCPHGAIHDRTGIAAGV